MSSTVKRRIWLTKRSDIKERLQTKTERNEL